MTVKSGVKILEPLLFRPACTLDEHRCFPAFIIHSPCFGLHTAQF